MSETGSTNNAKIVNNTLYLYIRTFITMAVTLYTSRVVLDALGVEDFGIWSVVGGVVLIFMFIMQSMSTTVGRFLTFAIGKNDQQMINKVFSTSIVIHLLFAFLIVVLCESIGLWFLAQKLVIPEEKRWMAYWVFHFSVISAFISMACVPYHSSLISYEKMKVYAWMGLWDAFSKLTIAYIITIVPTNRLLVYGMLMLFSSILSAGFIVWYVHHSFPKMRYCTVHNSKMYKELLSFSGCTLFVDLAYTASSQGVNMILNVFFGPAVNAARAISFHVEHAVRTFVNNFQVAANPQIIKNCAGENWPTMYLLMFRTSKFSMYLLYIVALPIFLEIDTILAIWLKEVPEYTAIFSRLMFCVIMLKAMINPIITGVSANGDIKKFQIISGAIFLMTLPVSYVCFSLGMGPASAIVVYFFCEFFACVARLVIAREKIHLSIGQYVKQVVMVAGMAMLIGAIVPAIIRYSMPDGMLRFILVIGIAFIFSTLSIYYLGLNVNEKKFVCNKVIYRFIRKDRCM